MKILNSKPRRINGFINTTPVSELERAESLPTNSLLHIVQEQSNGDFLSKSMSIGVFEDKMFESIHNMFKVSYWDTHDHNSKDWIDLIDILVRHDKINPLPEKDRLVESSNINPELLQYFPDRKIDFTKHLNYDFTSLKGYIDSMIIDCNSRMDTIDSELNDIDCLLSRSMTLTSTNEMGDIIHESVNNSTNVDNKHCQMAIRDGNKISNEWIVPKSGLLMIYGWLDSSESLNSKSLASSFCVIEGKINNNWEIIGVQTVIPAKNITYVGYSIPVREGLIIRARTGFTVSGKSGQYSKEQDGFDTLSNSTPNGFKCQVFSRYEQYKSK